MHDSDIIALYLDRDEQAIVRTQEAYGAYCHSLARNILGTHEDAEECVNDACFRAWSSIPPQQPKNLKLYLARLTRNLALDRYRAASAQKRGAGELRVVLDELSECLASSENIEELFDAGALRETLSRFVRSLPEREGDLFVRRYFFSESVSEIAKRFGLRAHHVTVLLGRTRQKLKTELERKGFLT